MKLLVALLVLLTATTASAQANRRIKPNVPPNAIVVNPIFTENGDHIQTALTLADAGATIWVTAGTYRLTARLTPKTGQTLMGELTASRQTILSGARVLTGWVSDSGRWYVTGQTQGGTPHGDTEYCRVGHPRCVYAEELFFNCATPATCSMKYHEDALADVGAGEWFFDYAADRIYVGDDPTGQLVETSVLAQLWTATPSNIDDVTLRSLVVEKFAAGNGDGAINMCYGDGGSENWLADNLEVRWNHGGGIGFGPFVGCRARGNYVHHNCSFGFVGAGTGIVVDGNFIAHNNILPQNTPAVGTAITTDDTCGFNDYWGAGGTKFVFSNVVLRGNHSMQNYGPGLWLDIQNVGAVYEDNLIDWNIRAGIFHEISCDAIIRRNYIIRNGYGDLFPGTQDGGGIQIDTSPNVEVYENYLENNNQGLVANEDVRDGPTGMGGCPDYDLFNLYVHDNIIVSTIHTPAVSGRGHTGVWLNGGDTTTSPYDVGENNRFENNTYYLGPTDDFFKWDNADKTDAQWIAYGHDDTGTITH